MTRTKEQYLITKVCKRRKGFNFNTLESAIMLAVEIAREGREGIKLSLGLGSRHVAAASITKQTKSIAVVVSESSVVRIFDRGKIVTEILPELWLLNRHGIHISAPFTTQKTESMAIASIKEGI